MIRLFTIVALVACFSSAGSAGLGARAADESLNTAKELYASAAYEDALAMLSRLAASGVSNETALQIDEYRSFCLYALGRTAEAESAARAVLRKDPLFKPSADETSPRVEAMFTQVRRQLLPGLIRDEYRVAKAAVDRKEFAAAEPHLVAVRRMIDQANEIGLQDEAFADLAVLADGFLDLARAATAARRPARAVDAQALDPPALSNPAATTAPDSEGMPADAASKAAHVSKNVYDSSDSDVIPPVTISQAVPPIPAPMMIMLQKGPSKRRGSIEVTIETDGRVGDAVILDSVNATYDSMILNAARQWRYKPATRQGVPVRFVKTIALEIKPNE